VEFEPAVDNKGYRRLNIGGTKLGLLHRLVAVAFIPNPEGKEWIDHINGNRLDNRTENLRWVTACENARNRRVHSKKTDLPRGVKKHGVRYQSRLMCDGISYHLGTYDTPEEASEVYEATAEELYGEYYRKP
jgi:hypothetical protein